VFSSRLNFNHYDVKKLYQNVFTRTGVRLCEYIRWPWSEKYRYC